MPPRPALRARGHLTDIQEALEWSYLILKKFLLLSSLIFLTAEITKLCLGLPTSTFGTDNSHEIIRANIKDSVAAIPEYGVLVYDTAESLAGKAKDAFVPDTPSLYTKIQAYFWGGHVVSESIGLKEDVRTCITLQPQLSTLYPKPGLKTHQARKTKQTNRIYTYPITPSSLLNPFPNSWWKRAGKNKRQSLAPFKTVDEKFLNIVTSAIQTDVSTRDPLASKINAIPGIHTYFNREAVESFTQNPPPGTLYGFDKIEEAARDVLTKSVRIQGLDGYLQDLYFAVRGSELRKKEVVLGYLRDFEEHVRDVGLLTKAYTIAATLSRDILHSYTDPSLTPVQKLGFRNNLSDLQKLLTLQTSTLTSHFLATQQTFGALNRLLVESGWEHEEDWSYAWLKQTLGFGRGEQGGSLLEGLWRRAMDSREKEGRKYERFRMFDEEEKLRELVTLWTEMGKKIEEDVRVLQGLETLFLAEFMV